MYRQLKETWEEMTGPGQPFEITKVNVRGLELNAFASAPNSLRDIWLMSAGHGDKDYLVYEDERWTYAQAHAEVGAIAAWLVGQGVAPGDRVAIAMRNYPEWMLAYWATVSIGAAAVGVNAWWTGPEMEYGMKDAAPKVLICDQQRLDTFLPVRDAVPACTIVGVRLKSDAPGVVPWDEVKNSGGTLPDVQIDTDEDACIFYTSGTTGRPKGAQLTHRGCVNNILSLAFFNLCQAAATAKARAEGAVAGGGDDSPDPGALSFLLCTPLFHVTANNCVAHACTLAGGKLVHMYKWDAGLALGIIEKERITNLSGVPVMSRELIAHPDFAKTDTSSLKSLGGGGAQLQPDLVESIEEKVASARPGTGYGMTETCGIITANGADFFIDKPASAGPVMPTFEAKCIDTDGNTVAQGEVGELCVRGSQVIRGYLNRPEATAEAIDPEGWLRTGDVARIDDEGFVFIVDRAKDMVLRGGENVYCAEVESALFEHDAVAECAVFGVEDDRLGEEVAAAVVVAEGYDVSGDALREHCAASLAKYKIPRYIWLLSESLPRNASGKFLKRQLREDLDTKDAV